jgi:GH15 family glucan-1,4-alpha-glucosidase
MRVEGYAPIEDYAAIGDGRTVALVARDGSIDWLCLPNVDSPSVFGRILDADRGGAFELAPIEPFEVERRYRDWSNVLETTFKTASGTVRVTDALTLADEGLAPLRELVRQVEALNGRVEMRWRFAPRFDFARRRTRLERRSDRIVATAGPDALALAAFDAGQPSERDGAAEGAFTAESGTPATLILSAAHQEPLVLSGRADAERRLDRTDRFWRQWTGRSRYEGAWRDEVVRSALALKLLVFAPSGAIVAAPTTSLPEWIGGPRNWDYRYTWLRDAAFTLNALLELGYDDEAHSFFWWFMHASRLTLPRCQVLYRVDGSADARETELDLDGYRSSQPVRIGNDAAEQHQLDVYGTVLDSVWRFVNVSESLDRETGKDTASIADHVSKNWRRPDAGIWEVRSEPTHFTHSKAMCWLTLQRACELAERGLVPDRRRTWAREAKAVRDFFEREGWDAVRRSYIRAPTLRQVDASLLTLSLLGCSDARGERMLGTIDAIRQELGVGPLLYRYRGEDGVGGDEGAFLPCSFWLADSLARAGRIDEAAALIDELVELSNDVGLFAEEIDPDSGAFLGNFPQALCHVAFVNAAMTIEKASRI